MYETSGSCRFSDFVVYNSRATQTPRNLPAGARQIGPPGPMYRHDTSPCSPRRVERELPHAQSQLSGPGKLWRAPDRDFWRPLQLAIVFSTAIAHGAEWHQTDHPKRSQSVSRPADPGAQFGATGRLGGGALLALFSLVANRRERKLSSRPGCRPFFFFSTLVKYSLSDPIVKYTNMRTQPCTGPAMYYKFTLKLSI